MGILRTSMSKPIGQPVNLLIMIAEPVTPPPGEMLDGTKKTSILTINKNAPMVIVR